MLLTCYLGSAVLFYVFIAKRAPLEEEPNFAFATERADCEVIELFTETADRTASRAA